MRERELMANLEWRVRAKRTFAELSSVAEELLEQLRSPTNQAKSTYANIPLELYGPGLPPELRSSWVFAVRGGINYPPERHPNSVQRMFALSQPGKFDTWNGSRWVTHRLIPGQRGLSIPIDVWHRMPVVQRSDWVVISFHTAEANELIEIVGDPQVGSVETESVYLAKA
jgi:hypothetical protein